MEGDVRMKYVSEITHKTYNTEKECLEAEKVFQEKQEKAMVEKKKKDAERSTRAKEVEDAYKAAVDANKAYREVLDKFVKDYGSFHMTYSGTSNLIDDVFNSVFRFF